jgi:hypothetical protein
MRALLFAVPASLVVSWIFSKAVELPAHRLARRTGRFVSAKFREYVATNHAALGEHPVSLRMSSNLERKDAPHHR